MSSLYYKPKGEKEVNLNIMQIMDKHLIDHPTKGLVSMVYLLIGLGLAKYDPTNDNVIVKTFENIKNEISA